MLLSIEPELEKFRNERGKMTVRLEKALYGCVQSAKLWYERLTIFSDDFRGRYFGYVRRPRSNRPIGC
jgi:hypothetical protein